MATGIVTLHLMVSEAYLDSMSRSVWFWLDLA